VGVTWEASDFESPVLFGPRLSVVLDRRTVELKFRRLGFGQNREPELGKRAVFIIIVLRNRVDYSTGSFLIFRVPTMTS